VEGKIVLSFLIFDSTLLTKLLECVSRMGATPQGALMTNTTLARPTIDTQLFIVGDTLVLVVFVQIGRFDVGTYLL
jgi:hypothetical protein